MKLLNIPIKITYLQQVLKKNKKNIVKKIFISATEQSGDNLGK